MSIDKMEIKRGYYSNGHLSYEHSYRGEDEHGIFKSWLEDGTIDYVINYENGLLHGGAMWLSSSYKNFSFFINNNSEGEKVEEYEY